MNAKSESKSNPPNELFTSITVNKGLVSSTSNRDDEDEDEIHYPKLEHGQQSTHSVDTLWMVGFLHHDKKKIEKKVARELDSLIQLPGSSVPPKAANSLAKGRKRRSKKSTYSSLYGSRGPMTGAEYECLLDAKTRLNHSKENKFGTKKLSPYHVTNTKLKKALQNMRSDKRRVEIRSKSLEKYFVINRNELEAAICLQCFWRRIVAERHLHRLSIEKMSAIIIQAAVRSMLTRCWLRVWKRKRAYFIVRCQAHLRQKITTRRWIERSKMEYDSARCIQAIVRTHLAKCQLDLYRRVHCVNKIIAQYHGYRGRKLFKIMRHSYYAIRIQAAVRVFLTKGYFEKKKEKKFCSARDIQRCWRGFLSRKLLSSKLRDRYVVTCQKQIRMFVSEVEYCSGKLESSRNYVDQKKKCETCVEEETQSDGCIAESATKLGELQNMLAQLTPRSVQQGWREQLERSVLLERAKLTKRKMDVVFKVRRKIVKQSLLLDTQRRTRDQIVERIASVKQWHSDLASSMHQDNRSQQIFECKREKRMSIADEKRRWKVQHKERSGKPIKMSPHQNPTVSCCLPEAESREKRLVDILQMQTYFTQLSQLDNATRPLHKLVAVW